MGNAQVGKLVELHDRVFRIDTLHFDDDGELACITAECLTPSKGDSGIWWSIEVCDESKLQCFTLQ